MDEIAKGSQKLLAENLPEEGHSIAIHSISKAGYITAVLAIVRTLHRAPRPGGEQAVILKNDFLRFHFFDSSKRKMC